MKNTITNIINKIFSLLACHEIQNFFEIKYFDVSLTNNGVLDMGCLYLNLCLIWIYNYIVIVKK
jgi:hypothetical protein